MTESAHPNRSTDPAAWPSPRRAWMTILVLDCAALLSGIDRFILGLLIEPIRADLGITDTQVSLIGGAAFALFFGFMALPLGRLADRMNRVAIIAAGIFLWSILTALCGLARSFWELFFARMGVGVGEASLSSSAYSLIADYFPPAKLPLAISTFVAVGMIGSGVALVLGGWIFGLASAMGAVTLPILGLLRPWQMTMIAVGLPGILLSAVMILFVREPQRRNRIAAEGHLTLGEVIDYLRPRARLLLLHNLGFSMLGVFAYSTFVWGPTFLTRTFGFTTAQAGTTFGLLIVAAGVPGTWFGGWIASAAMRRGIEAATMRVAILGLLALLPVSIAAPLMPGAAAAIGMMALAIFLLSIPSAVAQSALQLVTPNEVRGQVSSLFSFASIVLGLGLGPSIVALLTDYVFGDPALVGRSLAVTAGVTVTLAALLLWRCLGHFSLEARRMGAAA